MLLRHRRYFALLSFVLLATPLVLGIFRPDSPELILKEGRMLAPAPQAPRSWEAFRALPGQVDAYLKDHFGLRQMMIRTHRDLSHPGPLWQRVGAHRPQRPHVLSWQGDGASERRARPARPKGGRRGRPCRCDARRAGAARQPSSRRRAAEFLDHLSGRSSALGAKSRAENRIRSVPVGSRRPRGDGG